MYSKINMQQLKRCLTIPEKSDLAKWFTREIACSCCKPLQKTEIYSRLYLIWKRLKNAQRNSLSSEFGKIETLFWCQKCQILLKSRGRIPLEIPDELMAKPSIYQKLWVGTLSTRYYGFLKFLSLLSSFAIKIKLFFLGNKCTPPAISGKSVSEY